MCRFVAFRRESDFWRQNDSSLSRLPAVRCVIFSELDAILSRQISLERSLGGDEWDADFRGLGGFARIYKGAGNHEEWLRILSVPIAFNSPMASRLGVKRVVKERYAASG